VPQKSGNSAAVGCTWTDAKLQEPLLRVALTRFTLPWTWNGEEALLMSRCTDELGQVQPTRAEAAAFWRPGAVYPGTPDEPLRVTGQDNSIQPWRVASDGSVHNAIA
jgi:sulfane dehydrogenase subunit SoxC